MTLSPFLWSEDVGRRYGQRGRYIDEQGEWDVEYNCERACWVGINLQTRERREWSRDLFRDYNQPLAKWRKRDLQEIGRKRMVRIRAKVQIRREAVLRNVAWWLGWVWGSLFAVAVTITILKLLTRQILG